MTGNKTFLSLAAWVLPIALLSACGGGGSSSAEQPLPEPELPSLPVACTLPAPMALHIATTNAQPVLDKDNYVGLVASYTDQGQEVQLEAKMKGRGNSTWDMDKKPYKFKLEKKGSIRGLPEGKTFALLANHADKTLLRNETAFCLAQMMDMPYTPQSRSFDLTLNGEYLGAYQLTTKSYPVSDIVEGDQKKLGLAAEGDADFLIEIDLALRKEDTFVSETGTPFNVRSDTSPEQTAATKQWIDAFEALLLDRSAPDRLERVADLADVQSMIDHFLVRELLGEVDGYQASTYMYRLRGGKLTFGPVWDFDQALGLTQHNVNPEGWLLLGRPLNWHLRSLLTEPAVAELLQQRWAHMRQALPLLQNFVTTAAQGMEQSQQANFARWPIMGEMVFTNVVAQDSYEAEVQYLQDWLAQRAQWMDANIQELPALSTLLPLP